MADTFYIPKYRNPDDSMSSGGSFGGNSKDGFYTPSFKSFTSSYAKDDEEKQLKKLKEQAKQPTTTKINVGGKDIEIDEQTKKNWFKLNEEAKKALRDKFGEETFSQLKSALDKEAPKQGIFDKIKDVVDPNSAADIYRRQQANNKINSDNKDVPQMLRKPLNDPSQYVSGVQGIGKLAKGIGGAFTSQAVVPIDAVRYATAYATGNEGAKDSTEKQLKQNWNTSIAGNILNTSARAGKGVGGNIGAETRGLIDAFSTGTQGSFADKFNRSDQLKQQYLQDMGLTGNVWQDMVAPGVETATNLLTLGVAGVGGKEFGEQFAKEGLKVAGKEALAPTARVGLLNFAQGANAELYKGDPTLKGAVMGGLQNVAAGTVGDLVLGALPGVRAYSRADKTFQSGSELALENLNKAKAQRIIELGRNAPETDRAFLLDAKNPVQEPNAGNLSSIEVPVGKQMSDVEYTKQFNKLSRQYDKLTREIESGGPLSQKVKIEDLDAHFSQQLEALDNEFLNPTTTQTTQTGFTRPTEAPVQPQTPLSPTAKRIAQIDKINASVQKNGLGKYTPEQLRGLMKERKTLLEGTKFKSDVSSSVDSALSDAPITNTPKTMVQLTGDNAFRKFESKIVPAIKHIIKGSDSTARGKMFNRFAEQMSDDLVAINSVAKYMEETGRAPRGSYDAMIGMERKAVRSAADTQRWIEADSGWNRAKQAIYDNAKEGETLSSLRTKYDEYTKAYSELQIHDLYEKTGGKAGRTHTPEELADLRSRVAEFDSPGAREYAQGIVELYRNWLKSQLDEGEITPETYKTLSEQPYDYIKQQYEFTPEERAALAGKQPSNKPGRILKRQKETVQREMLSPAETMMATIQKGMAARAENNLKNQFVDIMLTAGDTGIRRVEQASPTKNHFTTVRNGKEVIWEAPAEITKAFDNLKPNQLGAMMNAARAINNVTKFGITSGNIGFSLLKNPPMDLARSLINSETPLAMLNPLNIASSIYNASGLSKRVLSDLQQKMYGDFMSRLGTESTRIQQYGKSPSASKVVMESIRQDAGWKKRGVNVAKSPKEFGRAVTGTLKGVEKQLAKTELATRFLNYQTAYKKLIKQGVPEAEAIDAAMNAAITNTTDFLAGGVFAKNANAWAKYFNAPIQGSRAFARAFEKRPITTTAKMFTTVGLPMMLLTANNTETPEKLAIYNEISDIDKENYHIYISDGATYDPETKKFTGVQFVRKPNDISAWFSGVQKSIERLANDEPAEHGKLLQFFTDTASSVRDNAPLPTTQKGLVGAVAGPATPIVEDLTNKSIFYGNDLVPEALRTSAETPEEQRYKNYSRTSKFLGGLLGKSPLVIDNYIRGYGGEVGTNIQNLIDRATGGRTDLVNEEGETYSDIGGKSFGETLSKAAGGRSGGETSRQFWEQIGGKESPAQRAKSRASKKVTAAVDAKDYVRAARLAREYNETVAGRVTPFLKKYQNSPSWDPDWDEYINKLFISDKLPALKRRGND